MNKELQNRIIEKTRMKIAISNLKKEDIEMKVPKNSIWKMVATFVLAIGISGGLVYATGTIIEKIWKEPEKYNLSEEMKITNEDKEISLTDEEIDLRVKEILNWLDYDISKISEKHIFKNTQDKKINYIINLENNMSITIDAVTGEFVQFSDSSFNDLEIKSTVSKNEAEKIAKEIYQQLDYNEEEYKLAEISKRGTGENESLWTADFCKEYDGIYNFYQCIRITFVPEIKKIKILTIFDEEYQDNEIVISKENALEIAKRKEELNLKQKELKEINTKLEIKKMNANIYYIEDNKMKDNRKENITENASVNDTELYRTPETIIRKVWTVEFDYSNEFSDKIEYYIDVTTGEIIGGNYTG